MKHVVNYKGNLLHTNSVAYALLEAYRKSGEPKDQAKLDKHMKDLEAAKMALEGPRYKPKEQENENPIN